MNETSKQKAIIEAYGISWDKIDLSVQENILKNGGGWTYEINESWLVNTMKIQIEFKNQYCRPKSLQGIENNNGWIKIESEEDLPKESCPCWIIVYGQRSNTPFWFNKSEITFLARNHEFYLNEVTHYQPIQKPKPPIY